MKPPFSTFHGKSHYVSKSYLVMFLKCRSILIPQKVSALAERVRCSMALKNADDGM